MWPDKALLYTTLKIFGLVLMDAKEDAKKRLFGMVTVIVGWIN
jgi:hypothetical protein